MNLEVAPCFDEVTKYSIRWSQALHEELGERRVSCCREEAVRQGFEDYVKRYNPELITFYNHGTEDSLIGNDENPLLDSGNVGLINGREMYTMCCLAAKRLGAEAYRKGARAWWGYTETFIFTTTDEAIFGQLANLGLILRRKKGRTWDESVKEVKEAYNEKIERLREGGNPWTVIALVHDRDALVCWTDTSPPPSDCYARRLAIRVLGTPGQHLSKTAVAALALFFASWGYALHDFGHQVWELKDTALSLKGGYIGFAGMLVAIILLSREYISWLGKK